MKASIRVPIAAALALAFQAGALAQTASAVPAEAPVATVGSAATSNDPATSPTASRGESPNYVERITPRFGEFAGSEDNLKSMVHGLRTGGEITLSGSGADVTFTSPTRPMGYGNITRTLDYAQRQLEAAGVTNPTPEHLHAALVGGTVTGVNGDVTLQGVLQLRSEGMGWGKIAHTLGIPPSANAKTPQSSASRVTTPVSGGGTEATRVSRTRTGSGADGTKSPAPRSHAYSRITTPLGPVSATYAPTSRGDGNGHGAKVQPVSSGAGSAASHASGQGHGNAYGRVAK